MHVDNISFVIPHREEGSWLRWTCDNARRQCPGSEILPIHDKPPVGVSYRRHCGILKAKNDIVVCCDAHIDLGPGFQGAVVDWLNCNPKDVLCFRCKSIREFDRSVAGDHGCGAYVHEVLESKPLVLRWHIYSPGDPEVACVLGGVYAFRRSWYIDGLNAVWRYHRSWGYSEPLLSIQNYLCGGRNICISDIWCAHLFKKSRSFGFPQWQIRQNWFLIAYSMMDQASRGRIFDLLYPGVRLDTYGRKCLDAMGAIFDNESFLASNSVNDYISYRNKFMI